VCLIHLRFRGVIVCYKYTLYIYMYIYLSLYIYIYIYICLYIYIYYNTDKTIVHVHVSFDSFVHNRSILSNSASHPTQRVRSGWYARTA